MTGIVYHEDYNKYDLGVDHPLLGDKPRRTIDFFREKSLIGDLQVFKPAPAEDKDLLRVHTETYVDKIRRLSEKGGMLSLDTPAPRGIYNYAALAAGGSMLCGEKTLGEHNIMINPLGGFHHAGRSTSSGFCFFNDIAVTTEHLRGKIKRFLVIDLDVHHANGTQDIYYEDPSVLNISFHQDGRTLYPGTGFIEEIGQGEGKGFTINLPLPPGTDGVSYLMAFDEIIPFISKKFNPGLIIYQSGVDTHHSDPLANLALDLQTYYFLASRIRELSTGGCDKLVVLFGGGYNNVSSIHSYFNITCGLLNKKNFIHEETCFDFRKRAVVENNVAELKKTLRPIWGSF